MKNTIIIDVDSNREQVMNISKPESFKKPENQEETEKMIMDDIKCLSEALCVLIDTAEKLSIKNKSELVETCVKYIQNEL